MSSARPRGALIAVLTVVALAGIMVGRAATQSRAELETAEAYRHEGRLFRAIEHYRRSLRWSFPLSPYRSEAISGLESVAVELEEAGDVDGALLALRSLVGGVTASRFMYSGPHPGMDELAADQRRLLDRAASPHPLFGTLLLLGFAVWIGSVVLVINRGFDTTGKLLWPAARAPLFGALGGLVSFVVGLLFA
jgi:hypothetical protein